MTSRGNEEKKYRLEAHARNASATAVITAERRGNRVHVNVEQVEPPRMAGQVRLLAELMAKTRNPWLYRGPRWAGRKTREMMHAGPLRITLEAQYGQDGWLLEATIHGPGIEAKIVQLGGETAPEGSKE